MRVLPVGPRCLLVELADLEATLALFDALAADPLPGVTEIVPAARTLMIRTAPGVAADASLARAIRARQPAPGTAPAPRATETVEIPVTYDGEDLDEVARLMGLSTLEVIAAHRDALWQVAFCGFAPGFAYMTCEDARFDLPRRSAPRTRIPAGSVALAGRFCGIYPQETPGGWQLIGRSELPMFDLTRDPPALLRPGVRARFIEGGAKVHPAAVAPKRRAQGLRVVRTAFPILVQDAGRMGQTGQGVSASGALDLGALRRANRAVGNPPGVAALEITLGPVTLRAEAPLVLALTGAARAEVAGHPVAPGAAFALDAGDEVRIAAPTKGMRSYLALRGGFDVVPVLGSAATDTLAHIGPPALVAGDVLAPAHRPAGAVTDPGPAPDLPAAGDLVTLPVVLGPRTDWFAPEMVDRFLAQDWQVTAQSSRVGIRLAGDPITRDGAELPSEGTATGAIQIPHSGQPVLFLADHPLTGGYPVIATLHPDALDLAGQLPPGARLRFVARAPFAPLEPEDPRVP
ncbi:carboxyltransferase domain-containing protein [Paracoccus gahaiensis]|uniref:Carboxyltransferase domain-containing protein n=1 Tax=Paracoccus gahaiensis TaxID=1706839 RepID=A0A4U0RA03_9RHOB|nr:carboxyltransferase domain-containing protein [Paracoccus gahaiensis]TJZ92041.1 carboxyltransferase domain-containing protein [Paracoccus gahaiensis]